MLTQMKVKNSKDKYYNGHML